MPIHNTDRHLELDSLYRYLCCGVLPVLWCTQSWWGATMSWECSPSSGSTGSPTSSKAITSSQQVSHWELLRLRGYEIIISQWVTDQYQTFLAQKQKFWPDVCFTMILYTHCLDSNNILRFWTTVPLDTGLEWNDWNECLRIWIQNKWFLSPKIPYDTLHVY
jgi:hypothetical protein